MAQGLNTNLYVRKNKVSSLDSMFGPYDTLSEAIGTILSDTSGLYVDNGFTFGLVQNNNVVEYAFKNITNETTRTAIFNDQTNNFSNYVEPKVSNKQVVLYKGSKSQENIIGSFTLNERTDGTIEIIVPDSAQSDWNASSGASAILNKPNNFVYYTPVSNETPNEILAEPGE